MLSGGLIDIHTLTPGEITAILDLSDKFKRALKSRDVSAYRLAEGRDLLVALLFYENSTRTRSSFEIAALRLGLSLTGFGSIEGSSVKKGESLAHTLDMFDAYMCDAVILRHHLDGSARYAAERIGIPVFNAGDGKRQHPTQTILDLFTIREHTGRLQGLDVGLGGDLKYGRTAHSLALALAMFPGNVLHLPAHSVLPMPDEIVETVRSAGMEVRLHDSLEDMVPHLDIFYQTRIQKERIPDPEEFEKAKSEAVFTPEIMAMTRDGFGLMHPLPIDKTLPGISTELDSHPKSIYKRQAGNGVPTRMAELAIALGLEEIPPEARPAQTSEARPFYRELPVHTKPRKEGVSIRPIRDRGVVIDHLKPYTDSLLAELLSVRTRQDIYRGGTVRSVSRPGNVKGILMIENRRLTAEELKIVATLSPGARVNYIEGGHVAQKIEVSLPDVIENVPHLMCPNRGCITRPEHSEHVAPRFVRMSEKLVRCAYCDTVIPSSDLFGHMNH